MKYQDLKYRLDNGKHLNWQDIKDNKKIIQELKNSEEFNKMINKINTFSDLKNADNKVLYFYYNYFVELERDFYVTKKVRLYKNQNGANVILCASIIIGGIMLRFNVGIGAIILGATIINDIIKRFIIPKKILENSSILSEEESEKQLMFIDANLKNQSLTFLKEKK